MSTMHAINLLKVPSWSSSTVASTTDLTYNPTHPLPVPSPTQLLIRIHATAITPYELSWEYPPSATEPRIPCHDIAGVVVSAPEDSGFQIGDRVFGLLGFYGQGGLAEYTVAEEKYLAKIPEGMGFVEAASLGRAGLTVFEGLRVRNGGVVREGSKVLVLGATGAVGRMGVQCIRHWVGASGKVIAMGGEGTAELKSLGADAVFNYREEPNWVDLVKNLGEVDVIFDCVGKKTLEVAIPLVRNGGKIVTIGSPPPAISGVKGWDEVEKRGDGFFFIVDGDGDLLGEVAGLYEKGVIKASVSNVVEGLSEKGVQEGWALALKGGVKGKPGTTV
ncbi:putative Quinone oxidoreductase [Glarea lozoyensis 74030]|nr:putative Quinone oxidoreductase [Glarea lozoyensis 74030]